MSDGLRPEIFREVNERIAEITCPWRPEDKQGFLCECSAPHCRQSVWLTRAQYDAIRTARTRFLAAPGHEAAGDGRVVERHGGFVVVEKLGDVAQFDVEASSG